MRHAEIIREMAASGDFLVPTLLGKPYHDKPPVMHSVAAWLTQRTGSVSLWTVRLPSVIAGTLALLATFALEQLVYDRLTGTFSAVCLLAMPGFVNMAREARPDMILCMAVTFCCLTLALGMRAHRKPVRLGWFSAAGAFAGLGVLTKGPFGVLFPVLFAILAPIRQTEWRRPRAGWVVFAAMMLLVAAIWAAPVWLRDHGEYLRHVIFQPDMNVAKVERDPVYRYFWGGLVFMLPATLFLPIAIADMRKHGYSPMLATAAAIFVVLLLVPQRRIHYLLPMYPFVAIGVSSVINRRQLWKPAVSCVAVFIILAPLYYTVFLRWQVPDEDIELKLARATLAVARDNATIYCVNAPCEAIAWVGQHHDRIVSLEHGLRDAVERLKKAESGSYLSVDCRTFEVIKAQLPGMEWEELDHGVTVTANQLFRFHHRSVD